FILQGDLEEVNSFLFSIYNRWGEKLYETDNIAEGWNGTYKGAQCQQGAYMYTLTATGINKKKFYLKGSVTLLR
ncbi:MAG: gliding motility-associated C-terminal domain-containing protein, partial [Bacteroidia bacterium]